MSATAGLGLCRTPPPRPPRCGLSSWRCGTGGTAGRGVLCRGRGRARGSWRSCSEGRADRDGPRGVRSRAGGPPVPGVGACDIVPSRPRWRLALLPGTEVLTPLECPECWDTLLFSGGDGWLGSPCGYMMAPEEGRVGTSNLQSVGRKHRWPPGLATGL